MHTRKFETLHNENRISGALENKRIETFSRNKKIYMDLYCLKYFVFILFCNNFLHEKYQGLVNIILNIINHWKADLIF